MAFDQPTRTRLARFVADARTLLTDEFTRQLQHEYGMDPRSGEVTDLAKLAHLDDARRETARLLRDTMEHYVAVSSSRGSKVPQEALDRIVREQAFTVLNRLCALRMAEARGLLIESIGRGYQSKGFQLYARLAGTALGETGDAYRCYLFSVFDEFAVDLSVLFERFSPQGRLFPRETTLLHLLDQINHSDIDSLWVEDETIGWIYQYFNSKEERKAMRDASQAPRNSRELAVRNQFFTPRYVVEFLTDNTLGRIWYEMTRGETVLVDTCRYLVRRPNEIFLANGEQAPAQVVSDDDLSQEELLKQPVYIEHRPLKDPRDIKMLDPACGSMHFGLYAFDLFERIYDEAWEWEAAHGDNALVRSPGLPSLHERYADKDVFLRDVPRLIIERNIHGIDIDPRAVQIAGLSLWLRAQRSWHAQGVKPQDRPQIWRSNVVCAEPMPGDTALLDEFLKSLRDDRLETLIRRVLDVPANQRVRATPTMADALCDLVRAVWHEMELAGEAGSLLKIEEALNNAIAKGQAEWENKLPLFRVTEFSLTEHADEKPKVRYLKNVPGEQGSDFWGRAEALVLAALEDYSAQAESGNIYQRRLFADDAARGFAFIDLCRKRYDVVLMNPPFGAAAKASASYLKQSFGQLSVDLYSAFVARWLDAGTTMLGAITSRTGFFLPTFYDWRKHINSGTTQLDTCIDLGFGVLDTAAVETAAYCISSRSHVLPSVFVRLIEVPNKEAFLQQLAYRKFTNSQLVFSAPPHDFERIPLSPFSYWTTNQVRQLFHKFPSLCRDGRTAKVGLVTFDDSRFLRLYWEVPLTCVGRQKTWIRFAKGGEYQKWYSDVHLVVKWKDSAREMKGLFTMYKEAGRLVPGLGPLRQFPYYFYPGVTWPRSTAKGFNARALPEGVIFGDKGPSVINEDGSRHELAVILAVMNTPLFEKLILLQTASRAWEVGFVQRTPIPTFSEHVTTTLRTVSQEACTKAMSISCHDETDSLFTNPWYCFSSAEELLSIHHRYESINTELITGLEQLEAEADDLLRSAFSLSVDDVAALSPQLSTADALVVDSDQDDESYVSSPIQRTGASSISYLLGVPFGRWDIRYATGEKSASELPDPFAPLPVCPPGMLQNMQGLPAAPADVPSNYPLRISWPGILVDDAGHAEDVERRVREAVQVIWQDRAEVIEQEACTILGVRSLRDYFRKPGGFFADHLKRYSKSRRQAPIYWPLSTPSGSYTLWLYYHRLTDQTLYTCVNDFVDPKIKQVTDDVNRLRQTTGRSNADERELERLSDLLLELHDFRTELLRIATFWKPNLNDGVQVTAAPLWKLFQHREWRKRLKETWEKLEAGEYDWAHLAYSIWPDRVRGKCKTDKSLAIAHDLEHLYEVPVVAPKKKRGKPKPSAEVTEGLFDEA